MNEPVVSQWIADLGIWPLIVILLPNVFLFRRYGQQKTAKKRMASLYQAIAIFLFTSSAGLIAAQGWRDALLLIPLAVIGIAGYLLRARMFPYRLTCPSCGRKHQILTSEFRNIYVMDDDLCDDCRKALEPDEEISESDDEEWDEDDSEDDEWDEDESDDEELDAQTRSEQGSDDDDD